MKRRGLAALGAESKGAYSIIRGRDLFTSEDFGNLGDYANFSRYERAIKRDVRGLGAVACDMHPGYNTTSLAENLNLNLNLNLTKVQHHHAHIASCMHENSLTGEVIGVAFDGTGFGADGNLWGGEFLTASFKDFRRAAHFKYMPMPGGEKAITEPWRMAAAFLCDAFQGDFLKLDIPFVKRIKKAEWEVLRRAIERGINSPLTSSAGRLFDAAAAVLFPIYKVRGEAEAAVRLQRAAEKAPDERGIYRYTISTIVEGGGKVSVIEPEGIIKGMVGDIMAGRSASTIAARFHNTLAALIADVCGKLAGATGIDRVALSGGVFLNTLLTEKASEALRRSGLSVYAHSKFSPGDAGISAGQARVAVSR